MHRARLPLIALCGLLGARWDARSQTEVCAAHPEDKTAVVDTLRSMYAAATADDIPRLHGLFAPGSYLFDGGVRYDIDSLIKLIDNARARGAKFVWSVTQPDVHAHCNQAWLAYVNVGSVLSPGASAATPMQWLESAYLEKQDGVWKIVFFHSTRVPAPEPAK